MTTLTAVFQPGTATYPARNLLTVSGSPVPPATAYTSNFATTVDGWTGSAGTTLAFNQGTNVALKATGALSTTATYNRTVTGLSVGVQYTVTAMVQTTAGSVSLGVTGKTATTLRIMGTRAALSYTWTATATSHALEVKSSAPKVPPATTGGVVFLDSIVVKATGTWQGTRITRTDANGTAVPVRYDNGGQDVDGTGAMTVYDYESALAGAVLYTLTDGAGAITYASPYGMQTNMVANPSGELGGSTAFSWLATGAGTTISTAVLPSSPESDKILRAIMGTAALSGISTGDMPATPGTVYGFRAMVRTVDTAADPILLRLAFYDGVGALISSVTDTATPAGTVAFYQRSVTATAPALTAQVRALVLRSPANATTGHRIFLDAALVRAVPAGDTFDPSAYFDGSTPNTTAAMYVWTGTPENSPSIAATASSNADMGVWVILPTTTGTFSAPAPPPRFVQVTMVTGYTEDSVSNGAIHQIIGRADPVANPGPLALRAGTFDALCTSYTQAKALRALLAAGDVAMLNQPTHPGMDVYFVATDVRVDPDQVGTGVWSATVAYREVATP